MRVGIEPTTSNEDIENEISFELRELNNEALKSLSFRGVEMSTEPVTVYECFPSISKHYHFKGPTIEEEVIYVVDSTSKLASLHCNFFYFLLSVSVNVMQIAILYVLSLDYNRFGYLDNVQVFSILPMTFLVAISAASYDRAKCNNNSIFQFEEPLDSRFLHCGPFYFILHEIFAVPLLLKRLIMEGCNINKFKIIVSSLLEYLLIYTFIYTVDSLIASKDTFLDISMHFVGIELVINVDFILANALQLKYIITKVSYKNEEDSKRYRELVDKYDSRGKRLKTYLYFNGAMFLLINLYSFRLLFKK